ncbi:MAG TPA: hypothetical protein VHR45_08305 [Thermoanaerobaculia bacterium]|nr:hypothetical protein [Thermoanaerobaculia bacterium]
MVDPLGLALARQLRRSLAVLATGLALGFGAIAPHSADSERVGTLTGGEVTETTAGASHPRAPLHCESSLIKTYPGCPACLLQINTAAELFLRATAPRLLRRAEIVRSAIEAPVNPRPDPGPARAPPPLAATF